MDRGTARSPVSVVASGLNHYAVPAFITDRVNRIQFANREFARLVGDPVREGMPAEQRFIPALMLGPYRARFPRREEELLACLPGIPWEVEHGNLSPTTLVLVERALAPHDRLRRLVQEGEPGWDGTVIVRDREGEEHRLKEVVVPLAASGGWHLSQWIPAAESSSRACVARSLTPRQREIARFYAMGLTSREVAERAGISVRTARDHLEEVYARLDVHSRAALAALLVREALL